MAAGFLLSSALLRLDPGQRARRWSLGLLICLEGSAVFHLIVSFRVTEVEQKLFFVMISLALLCVAAGVLFSRQRIIPELETIVVA